MERRPPCLNTGHRRGSLLTGSTEEPARRGPSPTRPEKPHRSGREKGRAESSGGPTATVLGQRQPHAPSTARGGWDSRRGALRASERLTSARRAPTAGTPAEPARRGTSPARPGTPQRALTASGSGGGAATGTRSGQRFPFIRSMGAEERPRQARLPPSLRRSRVPATATGHRSLPCPAGRRLPRAGRGRTKWK